MNIVKPNPSMELAADIYGILEDEDPEIAAEATSIVLAKVISKCPNRELSAIQAQKILVNCLIINSQPKSKKWA